MTGVHIKTRITSKGKRRHLVYYRLGGRGYKDVYAGSFLTKREAQVRSDLIAGELAAGRDPSVLLGALKTPPKPKATLLDQWETYASSRYDVGDKAQRQYRNARDRWVPILGADRDPHTITPLDVMDAVIEFMADGEKKALSPGSITAYVSVLRQVLDFCDVVPNPVNSPKVRLPKNDKGEIDPPTTKAWFAIRDHIKKRSRLALRLIESDAFRISECVTLAYGDVDFINRRIRVSKTRTKTAAGQRWIPVPDELLNQIGALVAPDDRHPDRRVFPDIETDDVRRDFAMACIAAGTTAHHPHELRHRRISLWFAHGIDEIQISRWAGHSKASMSQDIYGHVLIDASEDEWRAFWLDAYAAARSPREARVRHQDAE
jgi:integrase